MPKVSVILTSYNHEKYIARAIESVLNQTFTDFELIISDDCSMDGSLEVIQRYKDSRIVVLQHAENQYRHFTPELLAQCTGEYVAVHHSDDVWRPEKLARQVEFLDCHGEYAACFTRVAFIDEAGEPYDLPVGHNYRGIFDQPNRSRAGWLHHFFYEGNGLCHPSMMIRRGLYERYGLWDAPGIRQVPDFYRWIRLCLHADIYVLPEQLTCFRLRQGSGNTSGDRAVTQLRSYTEMALIGQVYWDMTDAALFLQVFPEAEAYFVKGEGVIPFALSRLISPDMQKPYLLLALQNLYRLITSPTEAERLRRLYNYTYMDFMRDTGRYDVFGLKRELRFLHAMLFLDYGDGTEMECAAEADVYVPGDGSFYFRLEASAVRELRGLRLDPDDHTMALRMQRVLVNGRTVVFTPLYEVMTDAAGYAAFVDDPQYRIDYTMAGPLVLEAWGEVKPLAETLGMLSGKVTGMAAVCEDLRIRRQKLEEDVSQLQVLYQREAEAHERLAEAHGRLARQNLELTDQNAALSLELTEMRGSTSWRITRPLRKIKRCLERK